METATLTFSQEKRIKAEAIEQTALQFNCSAQYIYPIINGKQYQHRKDIISFYRSRLAELKQKVTA